MRPVECELLDQETALREKEQCAQKAKKVDRGPMDLVPSARKQDWA